MIGDSDKGIKDMIIYGHNAKQGFDSYDRILILVSLALTLKDMGHCGLNKHATHPTIVL